MKKLVSLSLLASLAVAAAVVAPAPRAEAQIIVSAPILTIAGTPVSVACKNPGSSQDVAKTPILTNTTGATIAKGHTIMWKSTDGDSGSYKLGADLLAGQSVRVMGKAGNAYTCTGSFLATPDLTIQSASWSGSSAVAVKLANRDPHAPAGASTVRLEVVACSGQVLQSVDAAASSVAKGGAVSLAIPAKLPGVKHYFRIKADATSKVVEWNENNNLWDAYNSCVH